MVDTNSRFKGYLDGRLCRCEQMGNEVYYRPETAGASFKNPQSYTSGESSYRAQRKYCDNPEVIDGFWTIK